jgi:hypothetical protein
MNERVALLYTGSTTINNYLNNKLSLYEIAVYSIASII